MFTKYERCRHNRIRILTQNTDSGARNVTLTGSLPRTSMALVQPQHHQRGARNGKPRIVTRVTPWKGDTQGGTKEFQRQLWELSP